MCQILDEIIDKKTVTGYKCVIVDKYGHYYSPYTGVRYKKGKIPVVNCKLKHALNPNPIKK